MRIVLFAFLLLWVCEVLVWDYVWRLGTKTKAAAALGERGTCRELLCYHHRHRRRRHYWAGHYYYYYYYYWLYQGGCPLWTQLN